MTYCVEKHIKHIQSISLLQKKAMRIVSKKPNLEATNPLFIQLNVLEFKEKFIT